MIRYALRCEKDHRFESWFYDSTSFDDQTRRGLLSCPLCDSARISKDIMAPALRGRSDHDAAPTDAQGATAPHDGGERRRLMRAARERIMGETRDVGRDFAVEARRIHGDETSGERIRGQATLEEARDLLRDGIAILPLPPSADDLN